MPDLKMANGAKVAGAWIVAISLIALLPSLGMNASMTRSVVLICIMALAVSGLNLNFGYTGELNLGQAAVYASGAYAAGYVAKNVINDVALTLLISIAVGVFIGLVAGVPGLRVGGWMLAIISFFVVLLVPPVINLIGEPVGGFAGLTGIPLPQLFGRELDSNAYYVVVVVVTGAWFAVFRNIVASRHGNAMLTLKESPILTSSLGVSPYALKLRVYTISAIPVAMAGSLFSYLDGYIAPESFRLELTVTLLAASLLGGMVSVSGAVIGSAVLVLGPGDNPVFEKYALVVYGAFLLVGGVVFNDGIAGVLKKYWQKLRSRGVDSRDHPADDQGDTQRRALVDASGSRLAVDGKRLDVRGVSKRFGGVPALQNVSLTAMPGEVSALIGPNGSGKTTILNVISGFYSPDAGEVQLGEETLTGKPVHKVSQVGLGRTFQTPVLPPEMTVRDVIMMANFDRSRSSMLSSAFRSFGYRRARQADEVAVTQILETMNLQRVADVPAGSLALGTRRMVELARAVVRGESIILLDEVAAGLDEVELDELGQMVRALRQAGATIVLVEHNFTFVRAVADSITVLAEGVVIAQGPMEDIMNDVGVLSSYLGEGAEVAGTRMRSASPTETDEPEGNQ